MQYLPLAITGKNFGMAINLKVLTKIAARQDLLNEFQSRTTDDKKEK